MRNNKEIFYSDNSSQQENLHSEEDSMLFQDQGNLQPFQQYIPKKKKMKGNYPTKNNIIQIEKNCNCFMQNLIAIEMQKTSKQIYEVLTQNWSNSSDSFIFAINFKRNQEDDLSKFLDIMQEQFVRLHQKPNQNKKSNKQKLQIDIVTLEKRSDVKDIALQLHIKSDIYVNTQKKVHLFTVCKISNLSQKNLYCLQKNILTKQFCLLIPTFQNMKLNDGHGFNNENQKFYYQVYSNKDLFIDFFFECLISNKIKAYLPKQILNLISDFEFYPISYRQACRRFIYVLQKFEKYCEDNKLPKTSFVDLQDLIGVLNETWKKVIGGSMGKIDFLEGCQLINKQKFIKCVLEQQSIYTINQTMIRNALELTRLFQPMDQETLYEKFQQKLKSKIQDSESMKKYAAILQTKQQKQTIKQTFKKRKPKQRAQMLGFQKKTNYKAPKQLFEDKITKLIHQVTQSIRKQAKRVKWSEIQFEERIKPQLVLTVAESVFQDKDFNEAFGLITSHISVPLSKLINMYSQQEEQGKSGYGKIIYLLRSLQIMGLVQINKSNIRPAITSLYFNKAKFQLK